jgi:cytochrome oxidase Cu insertion factor (SCO1/SenC/PrrC family)
MGNIKLDSIPPVFIEKDRKRSRWVAVATFAIPALVAIGLLFLLISLQGGLETGVANLARVLPIGFAVVAGMVSTGKRAPDFTLPAVDGTSVTLSALRGRPVLLVFLRHLG